MQWQGGRRSSNIEDRRGMSFGRPMVFGGGALSLVVAVIAMLLNGSPDTGSSPSDGAGTGGSGVAQQSDLKDFASVILADTEDTWPKLLAPQNVRYVPPHMVLYTDATQTGCGFGEAAMGPFYCPRDQRVYLDLGFFNELDRRLGAPGDFPRAYVIAHEVGHHVQNLLGISQQAQALERGGGRQANAVSVRVELQADCFAGIWAHHAQAQRHVLDPGDIEEGLNAASAIGDDTLQRRGQGRVVPETFTHGTSAQRVKWFKRGFDSGQISACDTFNAPAL